MSSRDPIPGPDSKQSHHADRALPPFYYPATVPFVIPFEVRVSIFQQFIYNDRVKLGLASGTRRSAFDSRRVGAAATIRRNHVADDGFSALNSLGPALKERLAIRFIDQYGQEEAGIDGGGLFKEFLTS